MDNAGVDTVYRTAAEHARARRPAALAIVTRASGHTPQVVGARMLVAPGAPIVGTVGGGRFEHEVCTLAVDVVQSAAPRLVTLQLGADLGMCCGGIMEVLITPVRAADEWLYQVVDRRDAGEPVWLRTTLGGEALGARTVVGGAPAELTGARRFSNTAVLGDGAERALYERFAPPARMILFGAGHVSQPTARLGAMLGYRVSVVDDRPEWNIAERFPDAAERLLEPYEDYLADFCPRPTDALLIITRGHEHDQQVLEHVIEDDVAYIGMIGSRSKVHKARLKLRAAGVAEDRISRLHAPIGMSIGALLPEEIGVAIAAELVAVKRQKDGGR